MTRLTISLSEEEAERLRREARLFHVSVSELVRSRLFKRETPGPPPWLGVITGSRSMTPGAEAQQSLRETWADDIKRHRG